MAASSAQTLLDSGLLQAGDHIRVVRHVKAYSHHGIVVAAHRVPSHWPGTRRRLYVPTWPEDHSGLRVVHFVAKKGTTKGYIGVTHLHDFMDNSSSIGIQLHPADGMLNPSWVQHRALAHLGLGDASIYDVVASNCEHFSSWCSTGKWVSQQSRRWRAITIPLAMLRPGRARRLGVQANTWVETAVQSTSPRNFTRPCRLCRSPHAWNQVADGSEGYLENAERREASLREFRGSL